MVRLMRCLVLIFVVFFEIKYSICLKWVPVRPGDLLPENAVRLSSNGILKSNVAYIGRTKYLNTLQLVTVHSNKDTKSISKAVLKLYPNEIVQTEFEVLVSTAECKWVLLDKNHIPENIVRGGTAWNFEPIYIGREENNLNLISVFLTSNKIISSEETSFGKSTIPEVLTCNTNNHWVDATSENVPANSVSTGKSGSYVARLFGAVSHVPGVVYPQANETAIWFNGIKLESYKIQVLVEDLPKQYSWKTMKIGTGIPENAVVCGVSSKNDLTYISRRKYRFTENKVYPLSFSETFDEPFDILVENMN